MKVPWMLAALGLWILLILLHLPDAAHVVFCITALTALLTIAFSLAKPSLVWGALAFRILILAAAFAFIQPYIARTSGLDGTMYDYYGKDIAPVLDHDFMIPEKYSIAPGTEAYSAWTGIFYFAAGPSWPIMQVFNSLLGLIGALLFYNIIKPGKLVTAFFLFDPSLTYWTSIHGKDPYTFLFLAMWFYGLIRQRNWMLLAGILGMLLVRPYMLPVGIVAGLFALNSQRRSMLRAHLAACGSMLVAGLFFGVGAALTTLASVQNAMASGDTALGSSDYSSVTGFVASLATGTVAVLFRPFPFEGDSIGVHLASIYQVALSLTVLYIVAATYKRRRHPWPPELRFSLAFCVLFVLLFALISGNLGTIAREKAQMLPFLWCAAAFLPRLSAHRKHGLNQPA